MTIIHLDMMKKALITVLAAMTLVACSNSDGYKKKLKVPYKNLEPQTLEIVEYNKAFFGIDTANFEEGIRAIQPQFKNLLGDNINDMQIKYLKDFATDTFVIKLNHMVEEEFVDMTPIANQLKEVYQHFHYYYPEAYIPTTYTYVSGINYENGPVIVNRDKIMISLDFYLNNKDLIYDKLGMPRYASRRCQPAVLPKDMAEALYFNYVYKAYIAKNALIDMVERGKKLYFIEAMIPNIPDSILLGYTARQMQWAIENEGEVWATVVGNNMLYPNNYENQRILFADGPFTAPFGEEAPARLGEFLGLQIIRSFMSNNDVEMTYFMNLTNQQDIFQRSQYKPRK